MGNSVTPKKHINFNVLVTLKLHFTMGDIHYYWSINLKFWSRGQCINWSICTTYLMDVEQSDVMLSSQNAATFCGSKDVEGNASEEEVPGASLKGRNSKHLKVPE